MGLFNYKDYHQAQITGLISASYNIAVYANTGKVLGLGSFLVSRLFAKHPDRIDYSTDVLNEGWRDIQWKNSGYLRNMSIQEVFIAFPVRLQETLRQDLVLS
ncbi:TPA: hypothetical protein KC785_005182 [Escherichia coli O146]